MNSIKWYHTLIVAAIVCLFALLTSGTLGGYFYIITVILVVISLILFVRDRVR